MFHVLFLKSFIHIFYLFFNTHLSKFIFQFNHKNDRAIYETNSQECQYCKRSILLDSSLHCVHEIVYHQNSYCDYQVQDWSPISFFIWPSNYDINQFDSIYNSNNKTLIGKPSNQCENDSC